MHPEKLPKNILLVDDDDHLRRSLMNFLQRSGHTVFEANCGKQALEIIATITIDLVISDVNMPGGNGLDLLEKTRKFSEIPFIMMTGLSTLTEIKKARSFGVKFFLAKPFKLDEIQTAIQNSLFVNSQEVQLPHELIQMHLDEFLRGDELTCDAYMRFGKSEFAKVTHGSEVISSQEVARCHLQGVDSLYILKSDFKKTLLLGDAFFLIASSEERLHKRDFFNRVSACIYKLQSLESIQPQLFVKAMIVLESTLSVVVDHLPLFRIMRRTLHDHPEKLAQSVTLSLISIMLAKNFPSLGPRAFFMLTTASILQEIEFRELQHLPHLPPEILKILLCKHQDNIDLSKHSAVLNCFKLAQVLTLNGPDQLPEHFRRLQQEVLLLRAASFSPQALKAMVDTFGSQGAPSLIF